MKRAFKYLLNLLFVVALLVGIVAIFEKQWVIAYMSPPCGLNLDKQPENAEALIFEDMLSSMVGIFNDCCQVYAPHYWEANLVSFELQNRANGTQALDLAYLVVSSSD